MKPAKFEYFDPRSIQEVVALMEKYGEEASILAGGQSLVPLMNMRLARPSYIIDMGKIPELSYIKQKEDGGLAIGAMTTHREIEKSELIRATHPILSQAASLIGHPQVRNRGTIGGSLCHADPAAEFPTTILALEGELKALGPNGERTIKAMDFFLGYLTTSLQRQEILTEISIPPWPSGTGWAFLELSRRSGDMAIVGIALLIVLTEAGICERVNIALAGVGPTPIKAWKAEEELRGKTIDDASIEKAAQKASEEVEPASDVHASSEYRKEMVRVFTKRALTEALARIA